jgi:hypothetical protein
MCKLFIIKETGIQFTTGRFVCPILDLDIFEKTQPFQNQTACRQYTIGGSSINLRRQLWSKLATSIPTEPTSSWDAAKRSMNGEG